MQTRFEDDNKYDTFGDRRFWLPFSAADWPRAGGCVFIQIEAQPISPAPRTGCAIYAERLQDVNGFALGGGWYGVALGPYSRTEADVRLEPVAAHGQIPRDSYIAQSDAYSQQFWPVGAASSRAGRAAPRARAPRQHRTRAATRRRQRRHSRRRPRPNPRPSRGNPARGAGVRGALTAAEREQLQIALRWAGFYNAAIDGAFGRGTRNAMAGWQRRNGYEPTGILTTRQRDDLLRPVQRHSRRARPADGSRDAAPASRWTSRWASCAFDNYESPFAHYDADRRPAGAGAADQPAGRPDTLYGLYEIMQTLEIVPLEGERERRSNGLPSPAPMRGSSPIPRPVWRAGRSRASPWSGPRATRNAAAGCWARCSRASNASRRARPGRDRRIPSHRSTWCRG